MSIYHIRADVNSLYFSYIIINNVYLFINKNYLYALGYSLTLQSGESAADRVFVEQKTRNLLKVNQKLFRLFCENQTTNLVVL